MAPAIHTPGGIGRKLHNGVRLIDRPAPNNVRRLDMGALRLVDDMHRWGFRVDVGRLNALSKHLGERMEAAEDRLRDILGPDDMVNPGSSQAVAKLLFHKLRVQGRAQVKMTKGGGSEAADADQLRLYKDKHPSIPIILEWREYATIKSTFADKLPREVDEHSRIHTEISGTEARTGRYASSNPNLQNIPARTKEGRMVREAFVAEDGWKLFASDLSQIEMRWMAHMSGEPVMVEGYQNPDWDIHTQTAMDVFGLAREDVDPFEHRAPSKPIGFGVLYLIGPDSLQARILDVTGVLWTIPQCEKAIRDFYAARPYVRQWQKLQFRRAKQYGVVWDLLGRTRIIPQVKSQLRWVKEEGLRQCANMPIQNGATGSIKLSMSICYDKLQEVNRREVLVRPLLQVHDELIWEVREDFVEEWRAIAKPIMEDAIPLDVPVRSSSIVSDNWAGLKD